MHFSSCIFDYCFIAGSCSQPSSRTGLIVGVVFAIVVVVVAIGLVVAVIVAIFIQYSK